MTELVSGAAFWAEGEAINGWCWCPGQAGARAVELLADGEPAGHAMADRRADGIRANGTPHEHFGFLFLLKPGQRERTHRFELVESRSGVCFARLCGKGKDEEAADWLRRAAVVTREAAGIAMTADSPFAVAEGFGFAGRGLLERRLGLVRFGSPERPILSLIVLGGRSVLRLHAMLSQLAIVIADRAIEVLLVPRLDDDEAVALAGCVRGARLLNHGTGVEALTLAQGEDLVLIDGDAAPDWPGVFAMFDDPHASAGSSVGLIIKRRDFMCWAPDLWNAGDAALLEWAARSHGSVIAGEFFDRV